ncbi:endonuclease/exonuclease/phosphatase family protein [Halomicronema sp. CCY15110]|uniref:endonuclease/exonuclease/phosphatase family protein n=1 Tax=Halomicronema sp. CCY15110 TaxID=2767773 RepID=UPI001950BAAC|nr:endonuclease/exonuclease/phosphatase family protein [Halomicronema sp. CCY15110]
MEKQQFRIGTFNLNNLVLPEVEYYHGECYSSADYHQKVAWTARQLDRMQVDLVGFQEIFQEQALAEVLAATDSAKQHQLVMAAGIGNGPGVALATRFPVLGQRVYIDFPPESWLSVDAEKARIPLTSFSHPVLAVDVELPNGTHCTVFVVHLKSKRPMMFRNVDRTDPVEIAKGQARSLIRRAAEATALRYILMEKLRDRRYPVIVMGDVNDNHTSVTTQLVTGQPPWECWPFRKKVPVWDTLLYQVKDIQARLGYGDHYYTHIHNGHYDSLDHIMVSEEFAPRNRNHIGQVIYVSVYNDHLFDQTLLDDQIEPWKSDHGQVVATIALDD